MKREGQSGRLGSCLRAVLAPFLLSPVDRAMREAVEKLNAISASVIADTSSRAAAIDDLAEHR